MFSDPFLISALRCRLDPLTVAEGRCPPAPRHGDACMRLPAASAGWRGPRPGGKGLHIRTSLSQGFSLPGACGTMREIQLAPGRPYAPAHCAEFWRDEEEEPMQGPYNGKFLRVDLTRGETWV